MKDGYSIIMTTTDSQEDANRLAELLVTQQLAACVQSLQITSTYTWQKKLHREAEWLLMIKTRQEQYEVIQNFLMESHSYDTPEIIQVPIDQGSPAYLAWINDQTKTKE